MQAEDPMAEGECNCGAVKFEIDADLTEVYVCHCSICRKATGSIGIAVVVIPNEKLRWVQSEDDVWVGSKAVWDEIGDAGQQHLEKFGG
jgi:hypothetical protein